VLQPSLLRHFFTVSPVIPIWNTGSQVMSGQWLT
jgi:hypothetical protein